MKLSAIRVFVWDVEEARDFYSDVLGLPIVADGSNEGYCVMGTGGTQLILEAVPHDASSEDRVLVGRFTGLSFATENIEKMHNQMLSRDVKFSGGPELQFWGGWLATFSDPAGNGIQLVQLGA